MIAKKYLLRTTAFAVAAALSLGGVGGASASSETQGASDEAPILDATHWRDMFPDQYYSFDDSVCLTYPVEGTGMAGSLWDVEHVGNFSAGCLACHSTQQASLVDEYGDQWLSVNTVAPGRYERAHISDDDLKALDDNAFGIADARKAADIGITCYQCHGNTPGKLVVANEWTRTAAEKAGLDLDNPDLVCAQCHSVPDYTHILTDADSSTWFALSAGTDPDAVYDFFLSHGVSDPSFSNEGLEFDHFYGSTMDMAGANCYDCHTVKRTDDNGMTYTDHAFLDPGTHTELYENCSSCHEDSADERHDAVLQVQADYNARAEKTLATVQQLRDAIDAAAEQGADEAQLQEATALLDRAQFYYDYGRDTSEGVHMIGNSTTSTCFEKAVTTAEKGLALFE